MCVSPYSNHSDTVTALTLRPLEVYSLAMHLKLNLACMATLLVFVLPAFAQIDGAKFTADLRTKYGPPLPRETFAVQDGIEMIVDYAADGHVCKIQLPAVGSSRGQGMENGQVIDEITLELVPMSLRGKEIRRLMESMGRASVSRVEYENVIVSEAFQAQRRTSVTITLKNEDCGLRQE